MERTYKIAYEVIKERSSCKSDKYEFDYARIMHTCEHYFEVLDTLKWLHKRKNSSFYVEVVLEEERTELPKLLQVLLDRKFEDIYADDILDCYAKDHRIKY